MSPDIAVAIVSVLGSLGGAVFAWVQATRTTKISADIQLTIETLKSETERRRHAMELASAAAEPLEKAIDDAWHDIQVVKDAISSMMTNNADLAAVQANVIAAFERLMEGYRRWGSQLPEHARVAWHSGKSGIASVKTILDDSGRTFSAEETVETLTQIRLLLTDKQMILSGERGRLRSATARAMLNAL